MFFIRPIRISIHTKKILWLLLHGFFPLVLQAKSLPYIKITGIENEPLVNTENRLSDLYKDKSIFQESTNTLRLQIATALKPYGYFKPDITIHTDQTKHTVDIHVRLGPPLRITNCSILVLGEGAQNVEIQRVRHQLPIKVDLPFNSIVYEKAKDDLASAAENQGYLQAHFETSQIIIDEANYTAKIVWVFQTGPQYYFGNVFFKSTSISPELLHRYVPFKYGQPYSTDQVISLNQRLVSSGYFNTVTIHPNLNAEKNIPMEIELPPVNRVNYSIGGGYGTDTGPRGRLGLSVNPVNQYGHTLNIVAQGSLIDNAIQGQYLIPGADPVVDRFGISGGFSHLNYAAGNSPGSALVGLAQQHALSNYQRTISINALHERYAYSGFPMREETLFFPKAAFTWSKTTDPLFSPTGYNITFNILGASRALLSQTNLLQGWLNAKAAYTFERARTRLYMHAIQGGAIINDINHLPLSLSLLLGGPENLKGYGFKSVGPGKITSYVGLELQKETFNRVFAIFFVDAGDVYNPNSKKTKYDMGIGVMWVSPVGPIKIEVAQAVNQQGQRLPHHNPQLVINMGPDL